MPEFHSQAAAGAAYGLDPFTGGYIEAMYFTESCEGFDPEAEENEGQFHPEASLSKEAIDKCIEDCKDFTDSNIMLLYQALRDHNYRPEQAGHDFWLTRGGHGTGHWDRGLGSVGEKLAENARAYGPIWPYQGDDGKVYL